MTPYVTNAAPQESLAEDIHRALQVVRVYHPVDGAHHKDWIIDQIVRALCRNKEEYERFVLTLVPYMEEWPVGVAP